MFNGKMEKKQQRVDGADCTLVLLKIKNGAQYHIWHDFYRKMVWRVNAKHFEWFTVEF